jgi:GNAT superfamily N-acetyltransferase
MRGGDLPPEVGRGPPAEQYLIRAATVDDATGIAEVLVASWRSAYRGLLPQELLDGLNVERRAAQWRRDIQNQASAVYVAADPPGRLGGFIAVGPSQDQDAAGTVGALFAVYLTPRLWSRGIGGRLYAAGIAALAARFEEATLWVLDSNARARAFYERHGWQLDGAVKRETFDGIDVGVVRYRRPLHGDPGNA